MKLIPEQTRRRSLLNLPRAERLELSLWQSLLIAYLALLMLMLTGALIGGDGVERSFVRSLLMGIAYATPITALAHYGTKLTKRMGDRISWGRRIVLLLALWMASGALGSFITYGALLLFNDASMVLPSQWLLPMILGNAVVAIAIGGVVLLIQYANGGLRRRSAMFGQEDLLAAELRAARNVQQSLLPAEDLRIAGFDISGATSPAVEIGGDYYDYISFADGTKGILVADAAGKGVPAALIMAKFQGMAQALSIHLSDAHEFFVGLNDTLRIRLDRRSFITVGMIAIDLDDCCAFFRAGHNPLLLWRAAGRTIENSRPAGIALGLTHGGALSASLDPARFIMEPGDVAVLYSDGLTEATARSGESFGEERLAEALAHAATMHRDAVSIRLAIFAALAKFVGDADPHDDVTVVVVRRT